jgi:hypothetical protein
MVQIIPVGYTKIFSFLAKYTLKTPKIKMIISIPIWQLGILLY